VAARTQQIDGQIVNIAAGAVELPENRSWLAVFEQHQIATLVGKNS
jgi:hypothetical protein